MKKKTASNPPPEASDLDALIRKVGDRAVEPVEEKVKKSPSIEELVRGSEQAAKELNAKISLGLLGKRKSESWEEFEERAVQMFRDKGFFKKEDKE